MNRKTNNYNEIKNKIIILTIKNWKNIIRDGLLYPKKYQGIVASLM